MKIAVIFLFAWFMVSGCNDKPDILNPQNNSVSNINLYIYPNPASTSTSILVSNQSNQTFILQVFDTQGKKIFEQNGRPAGRSEFHVSLQNNPKGTYQAILKTNTSVILKKFIKA